ncbi:MAG: transposase [Firmicutes bacterium]|nr:transposase [Bacillota bacterium]
MARDDGPPIVLFEYQQTRAEHARKFLSGFSGYLHVGRLIPGSRRVAQRYPGGLLGACTAQVQRASKRFSPSAQAGKRVK